MSPTSFAQRLALSGTMPRLSVGMEREINLGFLAPLSGAVESWGRPGLNGCRLWEDWLNRAGGLLIGGRRYPLRIHALDCGNDPERAKTGARTLVRDHDIQLLMMLGGNSLSGGLLHELMDRRVLTTTLLPSDLSPDTPFLLSPSEVHPVYVVTAVDWLARTRPGLGTVALCAQTDAIGLPSLATYRAAFDAAGITRVHEVQYAPESTDVAAIAGPMLATNPDILCWCTSYTPMVHALTEYAHAHGYQGQILSCTLDQYDRLIARTSAAFMEGFTFQFPDFDDPALTDKTFFFNRPKAFHDSYMERFPGTWSAVSWEYAAILDLWHGAVQKAGSTQPVSVLAAMKQMEHVRHAFGPAQWWGREVFGIDNALVGDWPVVQIRAGRARIAEFVSVTDWLARHSDRLKSEMEALGQLWHQRLDAPTATTTDLGARSL